MHAWPSASGCLLQYLREVFDGEGRQGIKERHFLLAAAQAEWHLLQVLLQLSFGDVPSRWAQVLSNCLG